MTKASQQGAGREGAAPAVARKSVSEAAALWFARQRDGLTPAAARELREWLAADPLHAAALAELDSSWALVNRPRQSGQAEAVRQGLLALNRRRGRARLLWFSSGLGLAAAAALFIALRVSPANSPALPAIVLRPNIQTLADGSTVELNAGAEITVDFEPTQRNVRLARGEALFKVAKNPSRPFVVSAGGVAVRAVGTAFSVSYDPHEVGILVTEGKVQVVSAAAARPSAGVEQGASAASPLPDARATLLLAHQRATVPLAAGGTGSRDANVVPVSGAEIGRALAWRTKRVEFTDAPLSEAVKWFNRENRVQLAIVDPILANRRITGIFWFNDPDGFVRLLHSGVGADVERSGDVLKLRAH